MFTKTTPRDLRSIVEIDEDLAKEYLETTKEVFKWLEQRLR
jgi:hypothetical protein